METSCTPATVSIPKEVKEMTMEESDGMEGLIRRWAHVWPAPAKAAAAVFMSQLPSPSISKLHRRPSLIIPAVSFKWCTWKEKAGRTTWKQPAIIRERPGFETTPCDCSPATSALTPTLRFAIQMLHFCRRSNVRLLSAFYILGEGEPKQTRQKKGKRGRD